MALINKSEEQEKKDFARLESIMNSYGISTLNNTPIVFKKQIEIVDGGEKYCIEKGTLAYIERYYCIRQKNFMNICFYNSEWNRKRILLKFKMQENDMGYVAVCNATGESLDTLFTVIDEKHPLSNEIKQHKNHKKKFVDNQKKFDIALFIFKIIALILIAVGLCGIAVLVQRALGYFASLWFALIMLFPLAIFTAWLESWSVYFENTKKGKKLISEMDDSFLRLTEEAKNI